MNTLQIIQSIICIIYYILVGGIAVYGLLQYDKWKKPKQHEKYEELFKVLFESIEYCYECNYRISTDSTKEINTENYKGTFLNLKKETSELNAKMYSLYPLIDLYFKDEECRSEIKKMHNLLVEIVEITMGYYRKIAELNLNKESLDEIQLSAKREEMKKNALEGTENIGNACSAIFESILYKLGMKHISK